MYKTAFFVALALAIAMAFWAELNRREANRQLDQVTAPRLAAQAELIREQSPRLVYRAALIALEAFARTPTLETDALLRKSIELLPRKSGEIKHDKKLYAAAFAGHDRLVFSGAEGIVTIKAWSDSQESLTLEHEPPVHGITTSSDGAWIVTQESNNRTIRVWNAITGAEHKVLQHTGKVTAAKFSGTGQQILTYGAKIPATVWSLETGEAVFQTAPQVGVRCAHFDEQGKRLLTADHESRVRLWDLASKTILAEYEHDAAVCAISSDGEWMASGGKKGSVEVRATRDTAVLSHHTFGDRVEMLTFTADRRVIAVSGYSVHLWTPQSGRSVVIDIEQLHDTEYSASTNRIATVARDLVQVWDAGSGREIARMPHQTWVKDIAFDTSGRQLASVSDGSVNIWDLASLNSFQHEGTVNDVVFTADGSRVISASRDATTRVWDIATNSELKRLVHEAPVWAVAVSPDGNWFASGDADGMARMWSTHDFEEQARLAHVGAFVMFEVVSLAVSPDSSLLATGTKDGRAWLWEIAYGLPQDPIDNHNSVTGVAFSPDGNQLATAAGWNARLWDVEKLTETRKLPHNHQTVFDVTFDPQGAMLATVTSDGRVSLLDMVSRQLIREMAHDDSTRAVTFSPDGRYLASASNDRTARVWDVQSGKELNRILLGEAVKAVAFSPDGGSLATGDTGGSVRIWLLQHKELIADACSRLPRRLSAAEINTHLMGQPALHPCGD